jgi:hypothetical protein
MINFSTSSAGTTARPLSFVKFVLPLDHDAFTLSRALACIDGICHRGALAHEIVAVDDASRDGTAAEARRFSHFMPLWLIQHCQPMGRAMAFRTGLEAACSDACDEDLIVPIDPRRWPDPAAALNAILAARFGWDAIRAPAAPRHGRSREEVQELELSVYRAGLIKRHLQRFLETPPGHNEAAIHQLDQYLLSVGVPFHRLPALSTRTTVRPPAERLVPTGGEARRTQ